MLTKSATNCNTFLVVSAENFSRKLQGRTLEENHKVLFLNKNKIWAALFVSIEDEVAD